MQKNLLFKVLNKATWVGSCTPATIFFTVKPVLKYRHLGDHGPYTTNLHWHLFCIIWKHFSHFFVRPRALFDDCHNEDIMEHVWVHLYFIVSTSISIYTRSKVFVTNTFICLVQGPDVQGKVDPCSFIFRVPINLCPKWCTCVKDQFWNSQCLCKLKLLRKIGWCVFAIFNTILATNAVSWHNLGHNERATEKM